MCAVQTRNDRTLNKPMSNSVMSDLPKRPSEYDLVKRFEPEAWRRFVRTVLKLKPELTQIEDEFKGQFKEQKFQILNKWKKLDTKQNTDAMFVKLKHDFFCTWYHLAPDSIEKPKISIDGGNLQLEMSDERKPKRGCALIIANTFKKAGPGRERVNAGKNDVELMEMLWKETLKCDLFDKKAHEDLTAQEMKSCLARFSQMRGEYDYTVVVISTHGGLVPKHWLERYGPESKSGVPSDWYYQIAKEDPDSLTEVLVGEDERLVGVKEVKKLFDNDATYGLRDIPKIFILQYCRGTSLDRGVPCVAQEVTKADGAEPFNDDGSPTQPAEPDPVSLMPKMSDVLVIYPTHKCFTAFRNEKGSWLIQFLSEVFQKNWKTSHVVDMMTMVNGKMKEKSGGYEKKTVKAMSIFESSLTKNFYLFEE